MSDTLKVLMYLKNMFADMIYINGIIATELIKVTENLVAIHKGDNFINNSPCIREHENLNQSIIDIIRKYKNKTEDLERLEKHVLIHNKEEK